MVKRLPIKIVIISHYTDLKLSNNLSMMSVMKLVVKKFGGTSVGDIDRIRGVAKLVSEYRGRHPDTQLVVIVSAMAGETNRLIALAKSCVAEPDPRELDALLATGEQASTALLSMALNCVGLPAKSMDAQQARIFTDEKHLNACIEEIDSSALRSVLSSGKIPVIAGFQGVDPEGDITTLGRGGSDITAVAVAAALKADACYIYTDVEGVYSTDPRICKQAKRLARVCHEEMLEMASLGAKVLHARSVYFAMRYEVPLVVLSTFNPKPETWIVKEEELMEKPIVTGVTYRVDEAKLTVLRLPSNVRALELIFSTLAKENIFIDMITQSGADKGITNLSFTVPDESSSRALTLVQSMLPQLKAEGASLERDIAKVSVVGIGMRYHTGVAAKMFEALALEDINPEMISTSEIKISVVVPRKYCEIAVRVLHQAFIEMEPQIAAEV